MKEKFPEADRSRVMELSTGNGECAVISLEKKRKQRMAGRKGKQDLLNLTPS